MNRLERSEQILCIGFAALMILPFLYLARGIDDNTLASWRWVFGSAGFPRVFLVLCAVVSVSVLCARPARAERPGLLVILSAAAVVPAWSVPEMLIDAGRYFVQAKYLAIFGPGFFWAQWGKTVPAWTDMPLVPFLYGTIFSCVGEGRVWLQVFNAGVFTGAVLLTYLIGKRLWDRSTGFLAGGLLLGSPYLIIQVPMVLVDIHTMFFLTVAFYAAIRALDSPRRVWIVPAGGALCLFLMSKYSAWAFLPVFPVLAGSLPGGLGRERLIRAALVTAVAAIGMCLFLVPFRDLAGEQLALLAGYNLPALSRWQEGYVSTFLFQIHPGIAVAALYACYHAVRTRDRRFLVVAAGLILIPLLQIQRIRYLIPLFPFLALGAGYGLKSAFSDPVVRRFAALCLVGSSLVVVHGAYVPFLRGTSMENLRAAGAYLDSRGVAEVNVVALPQFRSTGNTAAAIPLLDLYTRAEIRSPEAWRPDVLSAVMADSPLRFTWELKRPGFYVPPPGEEAAPSVVLHPLLPGEGVSGEAGEAPSAPDCRAFAKASDVFRFRIGVTVCGEGRWPDRIRPLQALADLGQQG